MSSNLSTSSYKVRILEQRPVVLFEIIAILYQFDAVFTFWPFEKEMMKSVNLCTVLNKLPIYSSVNTDNTDCSLTQYNKKANKVFCGVGNLWRVVWEQYTPRTEKYRTWFKACKGRK